MGVQTLAHMEPSSQASKVVGMETIETPTSGLRTKTIIRNESRTRPVQKFGTHKSSFKSNASAVNRCNKYPHLRSRWWRKRWNCSKTHGTSNGTGVLASISLDYPPNDSHGWWQKCGFARQHAIHLRHGLHSMGVESVLPPGAFLGNVTWKLASWSALIGGGTSSHFPRCYNVVLTSTRC